MTTRNILLSAIAVTLGSSLFVGCMTPVTVTSDPPGASVYCRGSGRAAYKWKLRGTTAADKPVTFRVPYNAIQTRVQWPAEAGLPAEGSEVVYTKLLFKEDPVLHFERKRK